jgi:hypothetical protein
MLQIESIFFGFFHFFTCISFQWPPNGDLYGGLGRWPLIGYKKLSGGHKKEFIVMVDNYKPIWWLLYIDILSGH